MATKEQVAELLQLMETEKESNQAAADARCAIAMLVKTWGPCHYLIDDDPPFIVEVNEKCVVTVLPLTELDGDGYGV